jgi:hypothetical protein
MNHEASRHTYHFADAQSGAAMAARVRVTSELAQLSETLRAASRARVHLTTDERRQVCALMLTLGEVLGEEPAA